MDTLKKVTHSDSYDQRDQIKCKSTEIETDLGTGVSFKEAEIAKIT
jgi:hypothetical protein